MGRGAGVGEAADESQTAIVFRDVLRKGLEANLQGRGGVSMLDMLRAAANALWESKNLWARSCPELLPIEVGAIVHWARTNPSRAVALVEKIETWRRTAPRIHGKCCWSGIGFGVSLGKNWDMLTLREMSWNSHRSF